jgi:hypothetical protein
MESLLVNAVIEQSVFVVAGFGMFVGLILPIITLCYVLRMVEVDKIKDKEYEAMKVVRNAEHVKMINDYYIERDAKREEWLKAIESWSIVETSVKS